MYLYPGGHDEAIAWMREHAISCYEEEAPELKGKFKTQASNSERNPERYQDRIIATGNKNEPASTRAIRRKK